MSWRGRGRGTSRPPRTTLLSREPNDAGFNSRTPGS